MQFHPQKCNVIHVTNKRKPITHSYKLHDHILEVMENSKYLLTFDWHPRRFLCKKPKVLLALPLMLVIYWVQFSLLLIVTPRYLLFSNDLPEHTTSDVRLFADDCLLYRHIRNDEDVAALQKDLTSLQQWEETWQMQFHPQKCNPGVRS
jgi:hypothetical protein